jgi:hypothetical protein
MGQWGDLVMASTEQTVQHYHELAESYEQRGEAQMRDRFLVLAADAALTAGRPDEAERYRKRLLQLNPHHLLKPYASFAEAMKSRDVKDYIEALRKYPPKKPEELKVFRLSGEENPPAARLRQAPPPIPRPQSQPPSRLRPGTASPPISRPVRDVYSIHAQADARSAVADPTGDSEDSDRAGSFWVSSVLFVLVLAACILLAVFALVRPFWSEL